jgi:hypothetical protein
VTDNLPPPSDEAAAPAAESSAGAVFEPYENPAGGWGALRATALALREQSVVLKGSKALLSMNHADMAERNIAADGPVEIESVADTDRRRLVETNDLLPLSHHDGRSKTPSAKSIPVLIRPMSAEV